jgi:hypothetical protein
VRVLLRVLAPLLGLALAAASVLVVIEVVAAWVQPDATEGTIVPWHAWRAVLEDVSWNEAPVPQIAIGVGVAGLLLVLVGITARRSDVHLAAPGPEMAVTTSPRVIARLVGRRVRASEDVAAASVTASGRRIAVTVQGWGDSGDDLRDTVRHEVDDLLGELPLQRTPRVRVSLNDRRGLR